MFLSVNVNKCSQLSHEKNHFLLRKTSILGLENCKKLLNFYMKLIER